MNRPLLALSLGLAVLPLAGCVDLDPAMMGGYGGGGGYYGNPPPRPYYNQGYDHHYYDRDDHHHSSSNDRDYYGGPRAWYEAGVGIGKKDRREHRPANYRSHKSQYDSRTEREFARGYNDGYYR